MAFDPIQLRVLAERKENENWKFRSFLKQCDLDPDELDKLVTEITDRVWAGIDCTTCANCCKQMSPTLSEEEIDRLSRQLGIQRQHFIDAYLEPSESGDENPWRTRTKPCPFLEDNRCSIYDDRPNDCRGYPYLHEPRFVFRTMGMIGRTSVCPIVYGVMEEWKPAVGFRRREK